MERLTEWRGEHAAIMNHRANYIDRLAAYEDTGLTPEDVKRVHDLLLTVQRLKTEQFEILKKYLEAEAEGRLIVLPPVQIGETLFYVINGKIYEGELYRVAYENYHGRIHTDVSAAKGYNSFGSRFEEIGKTVFLTREEAERALNGSQD